MARSKAETRRTPLNRDRVLATAIALADSDGIEAVNMRRLSQELGVVPMALYKHVSNKDELLDAMVDTVVTEIDVPDPNLPWRNAIRSRILSARAMLLRHPWARRVMESRTAPTPAVLAYMDSTIATFTAGGLSVDLTHHVMHALGSRIFGFTQELFDEPADQEVPAAAAAQLAEAYPHIAAVAASHPHDEHSVVGTGCDDQFEFEFTIDLLLDGVERLHRQGWGSGQTPA
ncbi:AcrR family transcriptional regulator [Rhodococcus sp. PvR044]|jgi:AcrR family transcriptional regulator|uniref:TetR/AcrR family transcriptional regulator n=1 Tax=unclassified Rhodococcus (in: high G+C Gram-positive bacteria) TaxID=192944 RepID=UPI000BD8E012|nr:MULTISPECIES: TetR/AcrR family transcriptional regulator C-terminal domain-containing protein [unclassified Rhodococcus (in: high G+C Gram-positive bacteria)]MBP1161917.1 AcrR family transcriptional regulator [Rhodococcus sp. PvR099]PTR43373.1 TetR family transcriptional regulator [Rhodococcus sp. OK611]SNX91236.1 transcriptional regulator, TetR family [Rhodococcus sp. OK270]